MKNLRYILPGLGLLAIQTAIAGPMNLGPPAGAILDLAGTPDPTVYTNYTVSFVAAAANTDLTFALRDDPGFLGLDNISVVDNTTSSGNLVVNGSFETGDLDPWTEDNIYGAFFAGQVATSCPYATVGVTFGPEDGSYQWCDGSTQAYDAIDQNIATTVGNTYTVSFWLDSFNSPATFQQLSTNGDVADSNGNGADILVYAQSQLPAAAPEPAPMMMLAGGLLGLGALRRRR
jgi:hypothetical protein